MKMIVAAVIGGFFVLAGNVPIHAQCYPGIACPAGGRQKPVAPAAKIPRTLQVQQSHGLKIELERCISSNSNVLCNVYITSAENQGVVFDAASTAVDSRGAVLNWVSFTAVGKAAEPGTVVRDFIADARTAATISFYSGDDAAGGTLSALQLIYSTSGTTGKPAGLRKLQSRSSRIGRKRSAYSGFTEPTTVTFRGIALQ